MDRAQIVTHVTQSWRETIVPTLCEYIKIPNQSPAFDPRWREQGHMDAAVALLVEWVEAQHLASARIDVVRLEGRTPLIFIEVPGAVADTVLLYGHLDKQPPFDGWRDGLSPWSPVLRDGRLYGRGGADDGYSVFAAIAAIAALQAQGLPHARCVILIEACEESGSPDLPAYLELLAPRVGTPSLVVALDSGCGDYGRLWVTTSLRGLVSVDVTVDVLRDGIHSGNGGGIVPSSFRILRALMDRIERASDGAISLPEANVSIPPQIVAQARAAAAVLGTTTAAGFPFAGATRPMAEDPSELILNRTWRPQLEVIGAAGMPTLEKAGNVLRPTTTLRLSLRLPPTARAAVVLKALRDALEANPPYGATVRISGDRFGADGWSAPPLAAWLERATYDASVACFDAPPCYMGEGGTIPFMAMLGEMYPEAQFLITGVLGPQSNAHGPNEFLHLSMAEKLTAAIAMVLHDHGRRAE